MSARRGLVLVGVALAALGLRCLGQASLFAGDLVALQFDDGAYHARRAFYSFVNFPEVLWFDRYLNHPEGSPVPWPPGFDLALAATARAFGSTQAVFERVAAFASPLLAAATVFPIAAAGRALSGTAGIGLGAAALFAALPMSASYSGVGNPDHHAAVSLLCAIFLALALRAARPDTQGRQFAAACAGLAATRLALVLTWSGSLGPLALGESALGLAWVAGGGRRILWGQAAGALAAAALVALAVAWAGTPMGGPFSAVWLSWLHPLALLAIAAQAAGLALLDARRPASRPLTRVLRAALLGAALGGALLAIPAVREGSGAVSVFVAKADAWSPITVEQQPLFGARAPGAEGLPARVLWGGVGLLAPLGALVALLRPRVPAARVPGVVLAAWTLPWCALAVSQLRFGNELAPAACLCAALALAWLGSIGTSAARVPGPARKAALVALGAALLWPSWPGFWKPLVDFELWHRRNAGDPALASAPGTLARFALQVRGATPETAGFLDAGALPEYAIAAPPTFGHALHWFARRPTPADNFGPGLGERGFAWIEELYRTADEARAAEILETLGARYLLTTGAMRGGRDLVTHRLQRENGAAAGSASHLGRFRLVTEGPKGGRGFASWRLPPEMPPYKLFELVRGAVLEVPAAPGTRVRAQLEVAGPLGDFRFVARGTAGPDGLARLRIPYATEPGGGAAARGPLRIRAGESELTARVPESAVREGTAVRATPASGL